MPEPTRGDYALWGQSKKFQHKCGAIIRNLRDDGKPPACCYGGQGGCGRVRGPWVPQ